MRPRLLAALIVGAALLSSCQTARPLYYWGNYETVAYLSYSKPDKATLDVQREKLEADLDGCSRQHAAAHPGLHAQLGYLYFQLGRVDDALAQFEAEKAQFPESARLMDRLIERAKGAKTT